MKGMPAAGECSNIVGSFAGGADAHAHETTRGRSKGNFQREGGRERGSEGGSERARSAASSVTDMQTVVNVESSKKFSFKEIK